MMAETYVKGIVASLAIVEGDTEKGHWVRQDVVVNEVTQNGLGRPLHFQITGQEKIGVAGLQVGQTYVFHLYLESREGKNKNGEPMWFDGFNFGGTFSEYHYQYYGQCMYQLRSPTFVQDYQARMQGYAGNYQPTAQYGYQPQPQGYQPPQPQGYGYQPQPQGYQPQQPQGYKQQQPNNGDLPF